jgi:predicted NAD/FAD-binding protein
VGDDLGDHQKKRLRVAVIGTGISGMSAAWLLSQRHDVTVYERAERIGGHSHTVDVVNGKTVTPVDTGFIVYNETTYPNLKALFEHLDVPTERSDMSFAVSLDEGRLEYSGNNLTGLFAQKLNIFRPRFWSMLTDIQRFYREAPTDVTALDELHTTLGDYLDMRSYSRAFRDDHLLPMAGAIWSAPPDTMLAYPAASFIRFHDNHGLLRISNRPQWRTVSGGSRSYVERLTSSFLDRIELGIAAKRICRFGDRVSVRDVAGRIEAFDHVVIAAHADEALGLLEDATADERALLGAFRYSKNLAILHGDASLMPKRRAVWSSWNYIGPPAGEEASNGCTVTYWMNRLQNISSPASLFMTLNPQRAPDPRTVIETETYDHPLFDAAAIRAQRQLWSLQGRQNTWFCGSYFGAGFHEDGLQSGLAVAESLGGVRRPWDVANESGRIFIEPDRPVRAPSEVAVS